MHGDKLNGEPSIGWASNPERRTVQPIPAVYQLCQYIDVILMEHFCIFFKISLTNKTSYCLNMIGMIPTYEIKTDIKSLIRIAILLVCVFSLKQNAFSQETTSTLSGLVTDLTGQTVSGASVTVQHEATGYHSATQTNSKGLFVIPNLKPGGP